MKKARPDKNRSGPDRAYACHGISIEGWVADFVPVALGKQEPGRQDRFADHTAYREASVKLTVAGKSGEQSTLHALADCAGKPVMAMFVFGLDNSAATNKTPAKAAAPRKTARTFANMLPYCMKTQCLSRREVPAQPFRSISVESGRWTTRPTMVQRLKDSTNESVAQALRQERAERAAKTERLRELRLERDRGTATKTAKPSSEKSLAAHRPSRKTSAID